MLLPVLLACTPATAPDDRPRVRLDEDGFYGRPFPQDGRAFEGFPNPDGNDFVAQLASGLDGRTTFGTTSPIHFALTGPVDATLLPGLAQSLEPSSPVQLIRLSTGERHPIDVVFTEDPGPYGAPDLLTLIPLQGKPLAPGETYLAAVTTELGLQPTDLVPPIALPELAGFTVFTTDTPTLGLDEALAVAEADGVPTVGPFELIEHYPDFCVFRSELAMPVLQQGDPPYATEGAWAEVPAVVRHAPSRIFVTVPTTPGPWPVAVMVRTGGGGDRPLIDRGFRATNGGEPVEPGTGPALHFARAGVAGVMVDGPLGGLRNPEGADEQFLIFNITNPPNMRDNIRQSALELALLPGILDGLDLDASACAQGSLDPDRLALFGHSMGATIAPLVVAAQPRYELLLLSGAGGSWIENVIHKQLPLEVRPLAELMLGYTGRDLVRSDPALGLLQWMGEPADPPVYAGRFSGDVFMMQGMVDRYILPPIANATSVSFQLDRRGPALDETTEEVAHLRPLSALQPFVGTGVVDGPASANLDGATRVVRQYPEGPIEDGHEVVFQTEAPQLDYVHVLRTWAQGGTAEVP